MLKLIKAEVIDVIVGQYGDGNWYATSPKMPWLAAEGSSAGSVIQLIRQIAPALLRDQNFEVPFELKWHVAETIQ